MRKLIFLFLNSSLFCSLSASADIDIHFSQVQFYLNDQTRTESFVIDNQGSSTASCSLGLTHYQISENANLKRIGDGIIGAYNPANKLVRYSPRSVKIPPYTPQTVRVSFRRIPKLEDGEYVSFLRATCNDDSKVKTGAKIVYNLPVLIRHGNVNSDNKLTSAKLIQANGNNSVEIIHERLPSSIASIVGNYEVVGKESGNTYAVLKKSKTYAPAKFKKVILKFTDEITEPLQVKFTMEPKLGNEITIIDVTD